MFHCNTVDVKSSLWERVGSNSDLLFIGLRSSGYDLDHVGISADNYSIIISPIAVADEGLYTCSQKGVVLEIYNLSVKGTAAIFKDYINFGICHQQLLSEVTFRCFIVRYSTYEIFSSKHVSNEKYILNNQLPTCNHNRKKIVFPSTSLNVS